MKRIALAGILLGMGLAAPAAAQDPIFRDGFELECPPDRADCDGNPADCETSLRTLTDCGACGVACALEHGTCATGICAACPAGAGECDGNGATSCETPLNTVVNCGDCDAPCNLANASETCSTGQCRVGACNGGFGNCDGITANGCEQPLTTLNHCGGCGQSCNLANASETCSTGQCQVGACSAGFANCDGIIANGCEQPLTTLNHCGGCNQSCNLANASESCASQTCTLTSCNEGFSTCDFNTSNGCEVQHSGHSNAPPGEFLGAHAADSLAGFFCPGQGCDLLLTRSGSRGRHFSITALEESDCSAYISFRLELVVPPGVDYDLHATGSGFICSPSCSGTAGSGATESITVYANDDFGNLDDFTAGIEVRHFSGRSCQNWQLTVSRRQCR